MMAESNHTNMLDADLVARAYRKVMDRQELSRSERAALKRHEKQKEERLRWQYYRSIPKKHWREMSGRSWRVIRDQAAHYGIPCDGATIDLPAVVRSLHGFLVKHAAKLDEDESMLSGATQSPALERYREERAALARLDRLEREGSLLPRDEVRETLSRIAAILRDAGDALQRRFGPDALDILHEALDDSERFVRRYFAHHEHAGDPSPD